MIEEIAELKGSNVDPAQLVAHRVVSGQLDMELFVQGATSLL